VLFSPSVKGLLPQTATVISAIGVLYMLSVPGLLIIRIMRIHEVGVTRLVLFSLGLSVASIYAAGLTITFAYPYLGFDEPFSHDSLVVTLAVMVLVLSALCYFRDRDYLPVRETTQIEENGDHAKWVFGIGALLVILSITASLMVNQFENHYLMYILYFIVALTPAIALRRRFTDTLGLVLVFSVSLSLLFSVSLISTHITGYDINVEYYYSAMVVKSGMWTSQIGAEVNGVLSVTVLPPAISLVSGMSLVDIYKVVYPIIFSLTLPGLYLMWRKWLNPRFAALGCLLIAFAFQFYAEMPSLGRVEITEFLFVALLLAAFNGKLKRLNLNTMLIILGLSLIVSHYTTSYLVLTIFFMAWAVARFTNRSTIKGVISGRYIALLATATLAWYSYVSSSVNFLNLVDSLRLSFIDLTGFGSSTRSGLVLVATEQPLSHEVTKYLTMLVLVLIISGLIFELARKADRRINGAYLALSEGTAIFSGAIVMASYIIASSMGARVYGFILLVLAPYFVIGAMDGMRFVTRVAKILTPGKASRRKWKASMVVIASFLSVFFVFNSGSIYQIVNENPTSIALGGSFDYPMFGHTEVTAAEWLAIHKNTQKTVCADEYRVLLLYGYISRDEFSTFRTWQSGVEPSSVSGTYVFLGKYNIETGMIHPVSPFLEHELVTPINRTSFYPSLVASNIIFSNGEAAVYA
jgi:uncharacterized membrane protein